MPKGRLESFADGIFAFAATLLVLNIVVDQGRPLGPQLLDNWSSYAAYAVSFVTIGIIGANHHQLMHQLSHTDRTFGMITVFFLMFIAFIPFPTRLLASDLKTSNAEAAALVYGVTLTCVALLFNAMWWYAVWRNRLIRADADPRVIDGISRSYLLGPSSYAVATAVALLSPQGSAALYALIAVFYVFESSTFGRRTGGNPAQ